MKVHVVGGGVAGSLLTYLLSRNKYEVVLYDPQENYMKPCGDVVPSVYSPPFPWRVKYSIKEFAFVVDGREVNRIAYRHTKWNVIDKAGWINQMRSRASEFRRELVKNPSSLAKGADEIVVDSRGPYPMDRNHVYTIRAMIKTEEFDPTAVLEFDSKLTGFYWIFPDEEGVINVGAGFLENKNSKEMLLKYISSHFKKYNIGDVRGAPISVSPVTNKSMRIGEARGFVFPMSGEGIRPSALSAEAAYKAIYEERPFDPTVQKAMETIEKRIAIQHKLLRAYISASPSLRAVLMKFFMSSDILVDAFLEDKIDSEGLMESIRGLRDGSIVR